ncbi:hypothetical protein Poli38472_004410 [Pythium oligandrum]|uniref:Uncharacterized protein n=1 Tax=Pythium oligandrum TaxID=41045 RepID=A0A8K1FEE6_PYTOL|nr:hypothetical protein Poli38472_004410 [Pythium oligandrum]|eukprot:TMW59341.1 hypothetical protein Poli38472_004410 [Pythium oligandrum]
MARNRKTTKATKTEGPWDFLLPWFKVLANRLSIAEEDRLDTSFLELGRDPKTDWWISVRWDERDDDPKTLKLLREALVLTSTLADVDYDAWMSHRQQTCGLKAPGSIYLETKLLRPRFQFDFEPGDEIGYRDIFKDDQAFLVDWKGYAQPMLRFERPSAKFKRELERAKAVALKAKVQVTKPRLRLSVFAPTRVKKNRGMRLLPQ